MNVKLISSLILALLAFLFIFQNAAIVQVDFLFWSVEVSLVLLMLLMLGIGLIIGALLSSYLRYRSRRPLPKPEVPAGQDKPRPQ